MRWCRVGEQGGSLEMGCSEVVAFEEKHYAEGTIQARPCWYMLRMGLFPWLQCHGGG